MLSSIKKGGGSGATEVLLWTNASPNVAFAPQTKNYDLSGYKYVKIDYYSNVGSQYPAYLYTTIFPIPCPYNDIHEGYQYYQLKNALCCCATTFVWSAGNVAGMVGSRPITITTSAITFDTGGFCVVNGEQTQTSAVGEMVIDNAFCVPYKIYGIK